MSEGMGGATQKINKYFCGEGRKGTSIQSLINTNSKNVGTFIKSSFGCTNFNLQRSKFFIIIIGDVNQFILHCLIL